MSLNQSAARACTQALVESEALRIDSHTLANGGRVIDFGCRTLGGLQAGKWLAKICLANLAEVEIVSSDSALWPGPFLQVTTDAPLAACMGSQYAGWKLASGDFFAMGSGPMRAKRGREAVLDRYALRDQEPIAIGVLECDALPGEEILATIAQECGVDVASVCVCVAPTTSLAGVIQVVARSIETAMHKLFECGFDLTDVRSGYGSAPIPPIAKDFVQGIGRTNDAILYGGHVTLWVDTEDEMLKEIGPRIPSSASRDYGKPFAQVFKEYGYDFYQVDPGLFAPAIVTFVNHRSGNSFRFGKANATVLRSSFGEAQG